MSAVTWNHPRHGADAGYGLAGRDRKGRPRRRWRPLELAAMIAGFVVFWPVGLVVLGWKLNWFGFGDWFDGKFGTSRMTPENQGFAFGCKRRSGPREPGDDLGRDSGNSAFDGWKQAEIARLQAEFDALAARQREFEEFLLHLREAKDREEFERFMKDRAAQGDRPVAPGMDAGA